jgi:CubicO group peptidase (beta-lactamase class C family)
MQSGMPDMVKATIRMQDVEYVAALVELVTNRTFDDYSKEFVFQPLELNETAWYSRDVPSGLVEAELVDYTNGSFSDIGQYCGI